jgi:hypothetical protein
MLPTATIAGLRVQCRKCDSAVHKGRTAEQGSGKVAVAQLVTVNGIGVPEAKSLFPPASHKSASADYGID